MTLLDKYLKSVADNSDDWMKYYKKETDFVEEFGEGCLVAFDKPRIQKDFCFGYGMYLQSTDEQEEIANSHLESVKTHEGFLNANTRDLKDLIATVKHNLDDSREIGVTPVVFVIFKNNKAHSITGRCIWDIKDGIPYAGQRLLTKEELEKYLLCLETQLKNFEKRLGTYLKKYGTSKLNTWTYLRD